MCAFLIVNKQFDRGDTYWVLSSLEVHLWCKYVNNYWNTYGFRKGDTSCELSNSTLFGWLHLLALLSDFTPNLCCIQFLYWSRSSYIPSSADSLTQTVESDTQSWQNDSQLETLLDNALQCNVTASLFCDYPSIGILQTWVNIPTKNWRKKGRLSRKKSLNIRKFGSLCPARHR